MKQAAYDLLQAEFRYARDKTNDQFHEKWREIMDEYHLKSFDMLMDYLVDHLSDADLMLSGDASTGKLHMAIRKMLTLISFRNPQFAVRNETPRNEAIAELLDAAFPSELRRCQWSKKMRWRGLWALTTGFGAVQVGYSSGFHYDMPALTGEFPKGLDDPNLRNMPYGPTTEYFDFSIQEGESNILVLPSTNVISYPWNAPNIEAVQRWYVIFRRPLIDIYHDLRYDSARKEVSALRNDDPYDPYFNSLDDNTKANSRIGEIVQCFDNASRKWCVFSPGVSKPLMDWMPFGLDVKHPLHIWSPIESTKSWRGIPYALRIINQARSVNQLRGVLKAKIGRDGKTCYFYDSAVLTPEQCEHLSVMKDSEWFGIPGLSTMAANGAEFFKAVEFGKPSPELLQMISMFDNDLREMAGLDNPALNLNNNRDTTATEMNLRSQQTGLDIQDYIASNEEDQQEIASDVMRVMLQKWPDTKMVKVVGNSEYIWFWVPVARSQVLNNFTLDIVAGSTQKLDKPTYTRNWLDFLAKLQPLVQMKLTDLQYKMQGIPGSGVNWDETIKITADLFDPTTARRILDQRDPAELVMRLFKEYGLIPDAMSEQLKLLVRQKLGAQMGLMPPMGIPTIPGQSAATFEERSGTPKQPTNQVAGGSALQDMSGMQSGRMMSEAAAM